MKTLEAYLIDAEHKGVIDHALRMTRGPGGEVRIVLHPAGVDGETLDLEVRGDHVSAPLPAIEPLDFGTTEMVGEPLATKDDIAEVKAHLAALGERVNVAQF